MEDEGVPFAVLLDGDGVAAEIARLNTMTAANLLSPRQIGAGIRSALRGKRQRNPGRRPFQLGATFVIGPGNVLKYFDYEDFAGDHADIDEVIAAIG